MTLSDVSIRRPIFTTMMSVLLIVMGIIGLSSLGTDLLPDVQIPVVIVSAVYKGAGPQEVESQVARPLEDAIAGISGLDFIQSTSRENQATIVAQFKLTADRDRAVQEVREQVSAAQYLLPQDADAPKVLRFDISSQPILTYALSAELTSQELRELVDEKVEPALAQVEGVAGIRITGGDKREVRVEVDLDKAKSAGLSPSGLSQQLGMENLNLPAGRIELGSSEMTVRTIGQVASVDELRALPVARGRDGGQVRLDEVANVIDGAAKRRNIARLDGRDSLVIEIVKQPGSNTVSTSDQVKRTLEKLVPTLGNGFGLVLLFDQSVLIRETTKEVWIALIYGGFMAILIILIFLLDVRGTMISSLALPTSVVGTFFVMFMMDYSLNMMTLLALSLAIGLLIDDAVVVREAITHRLELGESPARAASLGTRDVYLAVMATTFSLVAVFVPVAFMPGIVGKFFKQFGVTISSAVVISLFVSFTLDPMLSARFSKARTPGAHQKEHAVARWLRLLFEANEHMYGRMLGWVLKNKVLTSLITLAVLGLSVYGARSLKTEFTPAEDRAEFSVDLKLTDEASLGESLRRAAEAEDLLRTFPEVKNLYTVVGNQEYANRVRIRLLLTEKSERDKSVGQLKEEVRALLLDKLVSTEVNTLDPPIIQGGGDNFAILVRVIGPDFTVLTSELHRIAGILRSIPGTADIREELNPAKPEIQLVIDRAKANDLDVQAASLAGQVRLAMDGKEIGKLHQGKQEIPIVVRLSDRDLSDPEALKRLDIYTQRGGQRQLGDVADVVMRDGPSIIERRNRERSITIACNLKPDAALGGVASELIARMKAEPPPAGYIVEYDGQMKMLTEQNDAFLWVFALALVFLYMVLASQFESFKHPFTILASVPLALIGAILGLVLTGYNLSLFAMIGVILVMGLVTKNAILLVDGALQNLRAGDDLDTALLKAGPRRLRPILMTSAAMAVGMIPTALGTGQGSESRAPMAIAVIGGVVTSTFLTLVVIPVVFHVLERLTPASMRIGKDSIGDELDQLMLEQLPGGVHANAGAATGRTQDLHEKASSSGLPSGHGAQGPGSPGW